MSDDNLITENIPLYNNMIGGTFESESESETEPDPVIPPEEFCFPCYPRSHEWFIKIQNFGVAKYINGSFIDLTEEEKISGEIKYLSSYHSRRFPTSICEIFENLILPDPTYVASHIESGEIIIDDVIIADANKLSEFVNKHNGCSIYLARWYVIDRENLYDIKILSEQNI